MNSVLFIWTDCNPSTVEKNHLILNGLEKSGVTTYVLGFVHSKIFKKYFESAFSNDALYDYQYGLESVLYKGSNFVTKLLNNIKIVVSYSWHLFKCLRSGKYSVIIVPPQPFELTFPTYIIGKILGIKIIPNIMEYYPALPSYNNRKNFLQRASWNTIVNYSSSYIVISHFLKDKFGVYGKQIFVLPAILSESDMPNTGNNEFHIQHAISSGHTIFLYTSSSAYEDLLEFTLRSLENINDEDFQLVVTGRYTDSQKHKWDDMVAALHLTGKVVFSGFLSDVELLNLQIKSSALLIPLVNNDRHCARFPQKVLGYMALGKPVVTTEVGEMAYYFKDGDTLIMCSSDRPEDYSKKLMVFFDSPKTAQEIGERGSMAVLKTFDDKTWGSKLKSYLERVEDIDG
jgi:glycosyltransferase involved in cell wall biosynthesis